MITIQEQCQKELDNFKDYITDIVQKMYKDLGEIQPIVFGLVIHQDHPTIVVIDGLGRLFNSDIGKDTASKIIEEVSKQFKCVAVAFAMECHMKQYDGKPEDIMNEDGSLKVARPKDDPTSIDGLLLTVETFDRICPNYWSTHEDHEGKYLRDYAGPDSGKWIDKATAQIEGKFTNLLKDNHSLLAQHLQSKVNKKENLN